MEITLQRTNHPKRKGMEMVPSAFFHKREVDGVVEAAGGGVDNAVKGEYRTYQI